MVPGKFNLYRLNQVIQTAMGWTNSHLHQFIIEGERYGIPDINDEEPVIWVKERVRPKTWAGQEVIESF